MTRSKLLLLAALLLLPVASCEETTQSPDAGPAGPMAISALKLSENSTNVLAFSVSWKTDRPATSTVEFGKAGSLTHRVHNATLTRDHDVLVIGLHERTAYTWRARSEATGQTGAASAEAVYTTRALPAHIPYGKITTHDRRRAHPGWTLMSVNACERNGLIITWDKDFPPTSVMYDMDGRPVWYNVHGLGRIGDARFLGDRVLTSSMADIVEMKPAAVEVDLAGKILWKGPDQPFLQVDGSYHHHFDKLAGGTYVTVKSQQLGNVLGDIVVEMDRDYKTVWSWKSFEHLRPDTRNDISGFGVYQWTHVNAVVVNAAEDWVLLNARNIHNVLKVRRSTGEILWALGDGGDFAADPDVAEPWFHLSHGLEMLPNGNLIMLDNGKQERGYARAIEYAFDEASRTTRVVWQYRGGQEHRFFSNYWGDADRLANGNTLISVGTWKVGRSSRFYEVTPGGELVWELQLPPRATTGTSIGAYNAQRLTPPLVEPIPR